MRSAPACQVIDVTPQVGFALPELLQGWQQARVLLVIGDTTVRPPRPDKGGLAAGALRRVIEHIERHLATPLPLCELAKVAGLSGCHFARAFKQSTGDTPHRFVTVRRIERAKALLRNCDRTMADIALEVGFSDQSHFTRRFLAAVGNTPSAFRKACR